MATVTAVRNVPEASIVELSDGRLGYIGRSGNKRKALVIFGDNTGREIALSEEVTVIKYALMLANEYVSGELCPEFRTTQKGAK